MQAAERKTDLVDRLIKVAPALYLERPEVKKVASNLIYLAPGHYLRRDAKLAPKGLERKPVQQKMMALFKRIHPHGARAYKRLVLGHDAHITLYATLDVQHFHATERDPFTGETGGWWEHLGILSEGLVTTAFRDFLVDNLQAEVAEFGDFKFHRSGTSNAAEANTHTALTTDSQITGVAGTQVEGATADIYKTVGTMTADASETWQEHGIFSQAGTTTPAGTMLDRNILSPTVVVVSSDQVQFTYELTVVAET